MRVVVAGGAGFLGSHLCDALLARGDEVVCLDNLITGRRANIAHLDRHPGFAFVQVLSPCPTFRPEQMEWKHHVRGFVQQATSDPVEAAQRIQADDGMSTGIIYRAGYPVFQPGGGETAGIAALQAIERELSL